MEGDAAGAGAAPPPADAAAGWGMAAAGVGGMARCEKCLVMPIYIWSRVYRGHAPYGGG